MISFRRFAIWYLVSQGLGGMAWWCALLCYPTFRRFFVVDGSPDSVLLAFFIPDCLLFIGGSFVGAYALSKSRSWTSAVLFLHAGGAVFAALYCWGLVIVTEGDGLPSALMMTPPLIFPMLIAIVWLKSDTRYAG